LNAKLKQEVDEKIIHEHNPDGNLIMLMDYAREDIAARAHAHPTSAQT
jgi:hypothetical protein